MDDMAAEDYVKRVFPHAVCRRSTLTYLGVDREFEILVAGVEGVGECASSPGEAWSRTAIMIRGRRYFLTPDGRGGIARGPGLPLPEGATEITAEEFYSREW